MREAVLWLSVAVAGLLVSSILDNREKRFTCQFCGFNGPDYEMYYCGICRKSNMCKGCLINKRCHNRG